MRKIISNSISISVDIIDLIFNRVILKLIGKKLCFKNKWIRNLEFSEWSSWSNNSLSFKKCQIIPLNLFYKMFSSNRQSTLILILKSYIKNLEYFLTKRTSSEVIGQFEIRTRRRLTTCSWKKKEVWLTQLKVSRYAIQTN